jgi:hypothetical protein
MGNSSSAVSQVADQVHNAVETLQQPDAAMPQEQQQAASAAAPAQCEPRDIATGKLMVENASIKIGVS